jgi:hypothetical protein
MDRILRILQFALLASLVLYALVAATLNPPRSSSPAPLVFFGLTFLSVVNVAVILFIRRLMVSRAEATLRESPEDAAALMRWRSGYIVIYAAAEGIALFGLVLHFVGYRLVEVAPFFVAGFILLLFYAPRRPANAIG